MRAPMRRSTFRAIFVRARRDAGFTLIELLCALAIIATTSAIVVPMYAQSLHRARVVRAIADVRAIGTVVTIHGMTTGALPDSLIEVNSADFRDPWGAPYQYLRIDGGKNGKGAVRKDHKLNPINSDFDLYSHGKDGVSKTQVSNKDSLDDIIRANDGGFVGLASDF